MAVCIPMVMLGYFQPNPNPNPNPNSNRITNSVTKYLYVFDLNRGLLVEGYRGIGNVNDC